MADRGVIIAERLIEAIGSPVIKKICDMWNYTSELKHLDETVKTIKYVLVEADSKRDLNPEEQDYIDRVKDVVYDADDLFDELHTLAEFNQLDGKLDNNKDHKFLKKGEVFLYFEVHERLFPFTSGCVEVLDIHGSPRAQPPALLYALGLLRNQIQEEGNECVTVSVRLYVRECWLIKICSLPPHQQLQFSTSPFLGNMFFATTEHIMKLH